MRVVSSALPMADVADPVIDGLEARWAADAVASLVRQLPDDSLVALVLRKTHRELMSLSRSAGEPAPQVLGPIRVHVAA